MSHKKMLNEAQSPEDFAREALGSAREQAMRWYEQQIAWRQNLVTQYNREIGILTQQYDLARKQAEEPPADTGPNPVPPPATVAGTGLAFSPNEAVQVLRDKLEGKDPNETQEWTPVPEAGPDE